jgi:2'-5' RNA ligase
MKRIEKYFLALMPPALLADQLAQLKGQLQARFQVKYALKSPSHLTLKMPFSYNEAKEGQLQEKLLQFLKEQAPFLVQVAGISNFGQRVIYHWVIPCKALTTMQAGLRGYCRISLHLVEELSDRNFQPHLTLAYKDLKASQFDEVLAFAKEQAITAEFLADKLFLLKRVEGRWKILTALPFGKNQSGETNLSESLLRG